MNSSPDTEMFYDDFIRAGHLDIEVLNRLVEHSRSADPDRQITGTSTELCDGDSLVARLTVNASCEPPKVLIHYAGVVIETDSDQLSKELTGSSVEG